MPCFRGIAVSVHADGAPLPEYGQSKQSRVSRITSYVPVPKPTVKDVTNKPEPAKFAISITLLTPGLPIPYSASSKPTEGDSTAGGTAAEPTPKYVVAPGTGQGLGPGAVQPYIPMTNSENETIAAYIYFDGRGKEEVATLLRPGEETWVNSRWVQVPSSEGGGLAEREFLFREVGLETWLNGLDLQGSDAAKKLEKRRQKFERRRRKPRIKEEIMDDDDDDINNNNNSRGKKLDDPELEKALLEDLDSSLSSDDEDDIPEAAGQIKVAMFRVIASGEVKKGEYSPQFNAHDDDDVEGGGSNGMDADVEHTTSFAKPKTLDPKTISTQTVTGIDGPDKPYATFTFFYRGERQLQKMGILPSTKTPTVTPASTKRRSAQLDFSKLGPLKSTGTVGFSAFRDQNQETAKRRKSKTKSNGGNKANLSDDSDDDDDDAIIGKMQDVDDKEVKTSLAPEDAKFTGELADGVDRIKLKRQRSTEPDSASDRKSPSIGPPAHGNTPPPDFSNTSLAAGIPIPGAATPASGGSLAQAAGKSLTDDQVVGSPLKRHRASLFGDGFNAPGAARPTPDLGDILAKMDADKRGKDGGVAETAVPSAGIASAKKTDMEDEEL